MPSDRSKKRKHAVALQYEQGEKAPKIIATGAGEIAKRILALAEEHDVPVEENDTLTDILRKFELGSEIPAETYRAVAEILAFLFRTDEKWRKRKESQNPDFGKRTE